MRKKVTSTDIAKAAGVSQATVSMVLNKKYNVSFSKETIDKVKNAARELGYKKPVKRTGLYSSQTKEQKKREEQPPDRCFLPDFDKSILCDAAAGD